MNTIKIIEPYDYLYGRNGLDVVYYKTTDIIKNDKMRINKNIEMWNTIINIMNNRGFINYEIVKYKGGNGYYRWTK